MKSLDKSLEIHINRLLERYPMLYCVREDVIEAYHVMEQCYMSDGKILIAGNGGSAADAEHMAGELMKRFQKPRPLSGELAEKIKKVDPVRGEDLAAHLEQSLMAIPLVAHEAMTTAYMNDVNAEGVFAQQLLGFGRRGDVFLGISTSGNSKNVIAAAIVAKAIGINVIGLSGRDGGELKDFSDVMIRVPEQETYIVQELHLPIYHCWCMMLEERFFDRKKEAGK